VRWPGSRESEGFLLPGDEHIGRGENFKPRIKILEVGNKLMRRGSRRYVRLRTVGVRWRFRRRRSSIQSTPRTNAGCFGPEYHPTQFRYQPPPLRAQDQLPTLLLEVPDLELWINELWHDFLIEPTPYLVASAITYLGFILLFLQYYSAIWQLSYFFSEFVPWDDDFGLG
jgi:hypothetical protein